MRKLNSEATLDLKAQKAAAAAFAAKWTGRGYEKGDTAPFWLELLRECLGVKDPDNIARFEKRTDAGFPDVTIEDTGVIIEQKSLGIDLEKPEMRQRRLVTPYEQALSYAQSLPPSHSPRFIITCNFEEFRIHDREADQSGKTHTQVGLAELPEQIHLFNFIIDPKNSRIERERTVSIKAGELIGELHTELMGEYIDPESEASQHCLNVLCVRLVFLLFAEDSGVLGRRDMFLDYMRGFDAEQSRRALLDLFEVLDTPEDRRDPYLSDALKAFPYINGALFEEKVEIPNFTDNIRHMLLFRLAQETDWSAISPTVFGGVFESTLNPDTRAKGGMHYTSVENIHKVIDPLFLDALETELDDILTAGSSERTVTTQLKAFQNRLASLRFLDPACGSGNFLTETYLCLRRLENRVLMRLQGGQGVMGFEGISDVKVSLGQFYGIEINDFAVRVAATALWIAELQANQESESIIQRDIEDLPLKDSANIVLGNALRIDWNDVLPAGECDYVMGNPPFLGSSNCSEEQKREIGDLFGKIKRAKSIDYVTAWYYKACEAMMANESIEAAFVSTNSITQGEQVFPIWNTLFNLFGITINFAWRTFVWGSEAADKAHVHCVIIGFGRKVRSERFLYAHNNKMLATNINPYLADVPNVIVEARPKPICDVPIITLGNKPTDGGNYVFTPEEKDDFVLREPLSSQYFHLFLGAYELLNNKQRYCLYVGDVDPAKLKSMPLVLNRIRAVREMRLSSSAKPTIKMADKPTRFFSNACPKLIT
ncbi:MAG: N-6 DNA methylase [Coriobacteriales bacterium]|jgi:hypothetical protein|nr:N-6 DNA methylase [Coriobacteriales bacterium]